MENQQSIRSVRVSVVVFVFIFESLSVIEQFVLEFHSIVQSSCYLVRPTIERSILRIIQALYLTHAFQRHRRRICIIQVTTVLVTRCQTNLKCVLRVLHHVRCVPAVPGAFEDRNQLERTPAVVVRPALPPVLAIDTEVRAVLNVAGPSSWRCSTIKSLA